MFARNAFIVAFFVLAVVSALLVGLWSGYERNRLLSAVYDILVDVRDVVATLQTETGLPTKVLQPSRKPGAGVTVNEINDGSLVLVVGYLDGSNGIRLMRRDGTVLADWPVSYKMLFPDVSYLSQPPLGDSNIDLHGGLIEPDGSVVFNFEYVGTVKLSRCGETLWTLRHPTHHSVEPSARGGYWIPGRIEHKSVAADLYPPFTELVGYGLREDLILRVSEDGEIVERKSVPELLYENGLETLLTATGYVYRGAPGQAVDGNGTWIDEEIVHLNKIGELPAELAGAFPLFEPGDLVLSMRNYNLVMVVDPDDWRVKWHRVGPWRRQHDPDFEPDGRISVFNNNLYLSSAPGRQFDSLQDWRGSNIMMVDPVSGDVEVIYGDQTGQEMLSYIRGKHERVANGHFLVTEFEAARAFEFDRAGNIVWEYINRFNDDYVAEITEARAYPASYFEVTDWSCPN